MRVGVWDLPVRLVHWLLVLLVPFSWWTAREELMAWHYRSGLAVLGLLTFRIVWGLIGSSTARFAGFVRGPRALFDYLHGRSGFVLGHSPLGALSVVALLLLLSFQVGLGLFAADEDGLESGPLAHLIESETAEEMAELHGTNFELLKWLILLHVAAILYYRLARGKKLVAPMVTGRTDAPPGTPAMEPAGPTRFLIALAAAAAAVWAVA